MSLTSFVSHLRKGKKRKRKDDEEEVEQYENEERTFDEMHDGKKVKGLLPIKTDKGIIPRFKEVDGMLCSFKCSATELSIN